MPVARRLHDFAMFVIELDQAKEAQALFWRAMAIEEARLRMGSVQVTYICCARWLCDGLNKLGNVPVRVSTYVVHSGRTRKLKSIYRRSVACFSAGVGVDDVWAASPVMMRMEIMRRA